MQTKFEELVLDDDVELEEIANRYTKFEAPSVTIKNKTMYFNKASSEIIPKKVKWFSTTEYIIGVPASENDRNAYCITKQKYSKTAAVPYMFKQKKIKDGVYKIIKYKNGFAFNRYKQLGVENG